MMAAGAATLGAAAPVFTRAAQSSAVTLFLCGDVMTGRGIDQVLPHPGDPRIYESYLKDARDYVSLAERENGPIPKPVGYDYVWGAALGELAKRRPDARIINLETSITKRGNPEPKGINYRMHPDNVPCIEAADIDCCVLANNHVLDWGRDGCVDTLAALQAAGIATTGAGRNAGEALAPAILPTRSGRVLVFGIASVTSGVPSGWTATDSGPGLAVLRDLSESSADRLAGRIRLAREEEDVVVVSIHWGGNWGHAIPAEQRQLARRLIDTGVVDVVHGHSSHHAKAIEIYRGKPILYGCGDFINDYEGIGGYEKYRGDLALMYFATLSTRTRTLTELTLVPLRMKRFQLHSASRDEAIWIRDVLSRESKPFGTDVSLGDDGVLHVTAR